MNFSFNSNMTSFKTKRQSFGVGSLIFLILFGAAFTAAGMVAINSSKIDKSWPTTIGSVVSSSSIAGNNSTTYAAVVKYNVSNQSYQVTSSTSSSFAPHIGDTRKVAYNPAQPNVAKVVESGAKSWFLYLFPAIGIACLILAPFLFIKSTARSKDINRLVQSGQKYPGVLVDVQISNGSNNNTSYKIVVAAPNNTGQVQNYVSDSLGGIGGLAMADFRNSPIPIDVYIDSANPSNYYVDVSDIPNLSVERIGQLIKSATTKPPAM